MSVNSQVSHQLRCRFCGPDCRIIRVDLRMVPPVGGPNLAVGLTGISREGASVRLKMAVDPGIKLRLWIDRDAVSPIVSRYVTVAWCRPTSGGTYSVGLRFDRHLTANELPTRNT
jgi:hypothetical protein